MRLGVIAALLVVLSGCVICLGVAQLHPNHDVTVAAIVGAALVAFVAIFVDAQR